MFAAMLYPTVYIAAGLGLGVLLLVLSYWRQSRQIRRQLQDLQETRQELKSINVSNIGLGRRIKSLESKRGPAITSVSNITDINDMAGAVPQEIIQNQHDQFDVSADSMSPDTIVAKDLRELQAQQQSLLDSLTALENEQQYHNEELPATDLTQESIVDAAFQSRQNVQRSVVESRAKPSFQESLAAHLEQEAASEQHFKAQNSEPEVQEDVRQEPYSYDNEPEPDLAQTPYIRTSAMLDEGLPLDEIERQSGLSKAEIKLMATMHKNMSKFALA